MTAVKQRSPGPRPRTPFAKRLGERRRELGLTQADVAEMLGVQTQTVSQWERATAKPQPRFYEDLQGLLQIHDKTELRRMFGQVSVTPAEAKPRSGTSKSSRTERLSLVQDVLDADILASEDSARPGTEVNTALLQSAMKIIAARDGRLTRLEAEIVQSLLACARVSHLPTP